ncbi:MAG: hypothetical protein EAX86_02360 [Candidatus Heimdallarchaeota archaeon]|nr:hypothetical protein [Candidatus Heimdallarchaeota archaeon]
MSLRENRFLLGILFPIIYEIGLIEAYLLILPGNAPPPFNLIPAIILLFPAFMFYVYSPYILFNLSRAQERYLEALKSDLDEIFLLKQIDLEPNTKESLRTNIQAILLPQLKNIFRRGYIDAYFTRSESSEDKMLSFSETLLLFSTTYGIINIGNLFTIIYLHFNSIDLDFIYIDRIINPVNVAFFGILFLIFIGVTAFSFNHSRNQLAVLISKTSYNLSYTTYADDIRIKTRQVELDSIRKFPLADKIGNKLAANWDLVSRLYSDLIESHITEELREYSKREVARALVQEQYSNLLEQLDLAEDKRKELELQFYLGQGVSDAIDDLVSSEEETESIKLDVLYTRKKLENWDEISLDEQISTFLFLWRSVESLFRNILWKHELFPEDQSWPSIINVLLKEKFLTVKENKELKRIRLRRNAMLHRSQDRFVVKEDVEELLGILQAVIDRS